MTPRTLVLGGIAGAAIIVAGWAWGWYETWAAADRACASIRAARSVGDAVARLREGGARVFERSGRTFAVFHYLGVEVAACSFRFEGGRVAAVQSGSPPPARAK